MGRGRNSKPTRRPTDAEAFLAAVDAAPADPLPRLVFADWLEERGRSADARALRAGWGFVRKVDGGGYGGGGGYGYGDGGGYGNGGGGDGGGGDGGDGDGGGGYGHGGGYGYGDGGGDGGDGRIKVHLSRGFAMGDGLHLICSPGGWAPYVVVAWCRVRDGWVAYAPGHRCVKQFGSYAQLSRLAAQGPIETTQLLDPSERGGGCSTAAVSRYEVCDPAAWAAHVPKPEHWEE